MKKATTSGATAEQRCPACHGVFATSSASRKQKVQCPQCREVVTLTEPGARSGPLPPDAARDLPPPPDWMARCEMLQARIEALEQQVEALLVSPRTSSPLIPERLRDLNPGSRDHPLAGEPPENAKVFRSEPPAVEAVPHAIFARKVQPPTPEIGLRVPAGDEEAQQVAEKLTEILARANWKVRGVTEDRTLSHGSRGLTLAAAPTLPLPRITGTLNALREAGFAVNFQLDPGRDPGEAMLVIGTDTAAEKWAELTDQTSGIGTGSAAKITRGG